MPHHGQESSDAEVLNARSAGLEGAIHGAAVVRALHSYSVSITTLYITHKLRSADTDDFWLHVVGRRLSRARICRTGCLARISELDVPVQGVPADERYDYRERD